MSSPVKDPREVIEQIRREYRVDQVDAAPDRYRDIASGTLPLVTEELYESPTHFFSELLQNADDNDYADGVVPSLTLVAYPNRLEIMNNEVGFSAEQVDAICSAAKSTKRDRKQSSGTNKGATGEKGVGFKAVFQVSDRPEIHSNGFHFRFDKGQHGVFGVVIPEWINDHLDDAPDGTRIVLPLRDGYQLPFDFLKSLQPELLLFLRRIRRLEFNNVDYGQSVVLERIDNDNMVTVTRTVRDEVEAERSSTHQHSFYVHRRRVDMADIDEPRRRMIAASEVAVALPLNARGEVDDRTSRRQLFAFLPVKVTALPFLAHADFVVVTSREGIRESLAWNIRLRDALGDCLAEAIVKCREPQSPGPTALRALPDPSSISDDFLRPIIESAVDSLKQEECVPMLGGGWGKPGEAIMTDSSGLWNLVSTGDAKSILKRGYVDPQISGISNALDRLGVARFGLQSLIKCLNDEPWRTQRPLPWYRRLYRALGRLTLTTKQIEALRKTPILPLARGGIAASNTTTVFRSLGRSNSYGFEGDLDILAPDSLQAANRDDADHIDAFLQMLEVFEATPGAIIDKYIVPLHTTDGWQDCPDTVLLGHLLYIRDHLDAYVNSKPPSQRSTVAQRLGRQLRVRTSAGGDETFYHTVDLLYLGSAYDDPHGMQALLGTAIADRCISPAYLVADDSTDAVSVRARKGPSSR